MRAFRVSVARDGRGPRHRALWEAGTAGVEVRPAPGGHARPARLLRRDASPRTPPCAALPARGRRRAGRGSREVDWVARFREDFRSFRARPLPRGAALGRCRPARALGRTLLRSSTPAARSGPAPTRRRASASAALEALAAPPPARSHARPRRRHRPPRGRRRPSRRRPPSSPPTSTPRRPRPRRAPRPAQRARRCRSSAPTAAAAFRAGSFDLVLANLMALLLVDRVGRDPRAARPRRGAGPVRPARRGRAARAAPRSPRCGTPLRAARRRVGGPRLRGRAAVSAPALPRADRGARRPRRAARAHGPPRPRGAAPAARRRRPRLRRCGRRVRGRPRRGLAARRVSARLGHARRRPRPSRLCASCSPSRRSRAIAWSSSSRRRRSSASPRSGRSSPIAPTRPPGPRSRARASERWERVASGAAEQCGRAVVPRVAAHDDARRPARATLRRRADRPARDPGPPPLAAAPVAARPPLLLLVGPAGGFEPRRPTPCARPASAPPRSAPASSAPRPPPWPRGDRPGRVGRPRLTLDPLGSSSIRLQRRDHGDVGEVLHRAAARDVVHRLVAGPGRSARSPRAPPRRSVIL